MEGELAVIQRRVYDSRCVGPQNCGIYRDIVSALRDGRNGIDVYEDVSPCGRRRICSRLELGTPEARD